ncbi:hypothetical protein DPMN_027119 [Dreissena polymorpha]|uniref:Uncharacterized protein n=1 Tax=Dreissena polymorpha TaxID=45954 RepID=A0A9D4RF77_DREPO|nr:hypothetical protein DPMN_027119 [Dreissena polymorpha]
MSSSRAASCSAGRPRGAQHKEYREYKAIKAHFRRAMRCVEQFMIELGHKLENDSVHDSVTFWRTVNSRKRESGADIGGGINCDFKMYRSCEEITEQWAKYFKDLYTHSSSPDFDSYWEYVVRQEVEQALTNLSPSQDVFVSPEMVDSSINQLCKKKACGPDEIYHEHMLYGKNIIAEPLSRLYTVMLLKFTMNTCCMARTLLLNPYHAYIQLCYAAELYLTN